MHGKCGVATSLSGRPTIHPDVQRAFPQNAVSGYPPVADYSLGIVAPPGRLKRKRDWTMIAG
jgi:hypothetical protein